MAANGAVRGCQIENGLASFLRHGHEAAKVLDRCQATIVLAWHRCVGRFILQEAFGILARHPVYPLVIRFDRTTQANTVLLDNVTNRRHAAVGQGKPNLFVLTVFFAQSPSFSPISEGRTKIAQALERKEICTKWNGNIVRGNQCGSIDRSKIGSDISHNHRCFHGIGTLMHHMGKCGLDTKGPAWIGLPKRVGPFRGQCVLEVCKIQIAGDQRQAWSKVCKDGWQEVVHFRKWPDSLINGVSLW